MSFVAMFTVAFSLYALACMFLILRMWPVRKKRPDIPAKPSNNAGDVLPEFHFDRMKPYSQSVSGNACQRRKTRRAAR